MKMTTKKGNPAEPAFKNGLSIALVLILLSPAFLPNRAFAAPLTGVDALFPKNQTIAPAALAALEEETPPTVQDVLLKVCTDRGYGQECAKHLLGMLWKESNNIATAVGDRGKARGYFQIHYKMHKVSLACAEDLECSANWTVSYLERNSYPKYVAYAVQCHNGCNIDNGYAASALRHGKRLWNQPLAIVKSDALALAN